ncbi:MAG: hypothetical protein IKT68_03215 [Clostridia bacterium]|nr:hypothetical protein [Clostridia bacterium]
MKRCLSFVMCIVLAVTACIYLPSKKTVPTVSAAPIKTCGHHNFTRTATDQILITQPLGNQAGTNLADVTGGNTSSGFEAGPGLTINGTTNNQTASILVHSGNLSIIKYSSATAAQKALLDAWSNARGTGTGGIGAAYMLSGSVASNGWGYTAEITWPNAINLSVLSHFYMQFWIVSLGSLSTYQSNLSNTDGYLTFNLIGTDSPHSQDGWNFTVPINQLAADSDGKVNTAHYYTFPISGAAGKYGTLNSVKKMCIRYNSKGNGSGNSPDIILGKFMMEVPTDNVQTGLSYKDANGNNYTASNAPDPQQITSYRIVGKDTANSVCGVRYPMFIGGKSTFVVALRWGNYSIDLPFFWAWRYKANRSQTSTMVVQQSGGAYGCECRRNNTKYLSSTTHYQVKYS